MKKLHQERWVKTHANLIAAAIKLFGENGVEDTTVDQIALEASVSKGAFFNHFNSKNDILIEVRKQLLAGNKKLSKLNPTIKRLQRNKTAFAYVDVSLELHRQRRSSRSVKVAVA